MEPNDKLDVSCNGSEFTDDFTQIKGTGEQMNRCLKQFRQLFPEEKNYFLLTNYKKGVFQYSMDKEMDQKMRNMPRSQFESALEQEKMRKESFVRQFEKTYAGLTMSFKKYMESEILYDHGLKLLAYGHCFGNRHGVLDTYYDFLENIPIQNDLGIQNPKYQQYLAGVINYRHDKQGTSETPYKDQYHLAKDFLQNKPLYFVQSYLLTKAFKRSASDDLLAEYSDFVGSNSFADLDGPVVTAFQELNRYAPGVSAPYFDLVDLEGNSVNMNDFQGKFVYLEFWATWCRPCLQRISALQKVESELQSEEIVFLHISLDESVGSWKGTVEINNFQGQHLYAGELGVKSQVAIDYDVKALPAYFIIDKSGRFVSAPAKADVKTIKSFLSELINRSY